MYSVTIIGIGRIGSALARSLPASKYRIDSLVVRDPEAFIDTSSISGIKAPAVGLSALGRVRSDIIFVTTQEREIEGVVQTIGPLIDRDSYVFHTSGALSSEVLDPLRKRGSYVGSVHPLVSVSGADGIREPFEGVYFGVEGDAEAVVLGSTIAGDLGGIPFSIETSKKAAYHAAAVMACGHVVALMDAAFELMSECGPDAAFSQELLIPLVHSTIANLSIQSPSEALTGPFARADVETVDRHLSELTRGPNSKLLGIYLALGERSLDLAVVRGADKGRVKQIRDRLSIAKASIR